LGRKVIRTWTEEKTRIQSKKKILRGKHKARVRRRKKRRKQVGPPRTKDMKVPRKMGAISEGTGS